MSLIHECPYRGVPLYSFTPCLPLSSPYPSPPPPPPPPPLSLSLSQLIATVQQTQPTIQLLLSTSDFVGAIDLITTTQDVLQNDLRGVHSLRSDYMIVIGFIYTMWCVQCIFFSSIYLSFLTPSLTHCLPLCDSLLSL